MIKSPDQRLMEWQVLMAALEGALAAKNYQEAKCLALSALEEAEWFEESDSNLWFSIELVAQVSFELRDYAEAAVFLTRLLRKYVHYLGLNHSAVLVTMQNLALVYQESGRPEAAQRLYNVASSLVKDGQVLGESTPEAFGLVEKFVRSR
jgi:tetratricopeptide (TPR) repeat protein